MSFSIPGIIEAVSVLVVVVFLSYVLVKLGKLIDKLSDKIEGGSD